MPGIHDEVHTDAHGAATTVCARLAKLLGGAVSHRSAAKRCRQLLYDLALPDTFTIDELCDKVEIYRGGRKILRRATHLDGTTPTGLLVATADVDMILYPVNTTPLHQIHITAHELGHALLKHEGRKTAVSAAEYSHAVLDPLDAIVQRKPSSPLAHALIKTMLGRTTYTDEQEFEAELFATMAMVARAPRSHSVAQRNAVPLPAGLRSLFEMPSLVSTPPRA
jgi:hypothetical protein